jgi:uncharacterized RDD family membrane protein YckC
MEIVKVTTSQHVEIDYPVAGLGERIAARLIDGAIIGGVIFLLVISLMAMGIFDSNKVVLIISIVILGVFFSFYDLIFEIFWNGQSLGKRIMKIKVISLDGAQPTIGQYFMRWVFRIVDFTFTGSICAFLCVAISEKKQRVGDMVAGTTLIKTVPRTNFNQIAFHPVEEEYQPVFENVNQLSDRDIELLHEVINTYYKTYNATLIYQMADKIKGILTIEIPAGMNELEFLKTIIKDYNDVTSRSN